MVEYREKESMWYNETDSLAHEQNQRDSHVESIIVEALIHNYDKMEGLYESKLRECLERACRCVDEETDDERK